MSTRKFLVKHSYAIERIVWSTCSQDAAQRYALDYSVRGALVTVWTSDKGVSTSYFVKKDGTIGGI